MNDNRGIVSAKLIIAITGIVVGIALIGAGIWATAVSGPAYKVAKGFVNLANDLKEIQNPMYETIGLPELVEMMQDDGYHTESRLDVSTDVLKPLLGISLTMGVDSSFDKDMKSKQLSGNSEISVMNFKLTDIQAYANEDTICVAFPILGIEGLFIDTQHIAEKYNQSIFADKFGKMEEDFSLNLFEKTASLTDANSLDSDKDLDLKLLKKNMKIEKVEKNKYRVVIDKALFETLAADEDDEKTPENAEKSGKMKLDHDVTVLIEFDDKNSITEVALEEAVHVQEIGTLDSGVFLVDYDHNKISNIQVKCDVIPESAQEATSISIQYEPVVSKDEHTSDTIVKVTQDSKEHTVEITSKFQTASNSFTAKIKDAQEDIELVIEGSLSNVVKGKSLDVNIDSLKVINDNQNLMKIKGNCKIAPCEKEIEQLVKPQVNIWGLTMDDMQGYYQSIIGKFSGMLGGLF